MWSLGICAFARPACAISARTFSMRQAAGGKRDFARRVVAVCDHGYENAARLRSFGGNSIGTQL